MRGGHIETSAGRVGAKRRIETKRVVRRVARLVSIRRSRYALLLDPSRLLDRRWLSQPLHVPGLEESAWEWRWAPYDEPTYRAVLAHVRADDVVLEIGAGDLRLARRLARRACRVYAIEIQPTCIAEGLAAMGPVPDNLHVVCGDARHLSFPRGITLGVLLMRHCTHFRLYADKLVQVGCQRLITNARWRLGVEVIDLRAPRMPFDHLAMGWYACWCGTVGFVPGPAERLTPALEAIVHEVADCPACRRIAGAPQGAGDTGQGRGLGGLIGFSGSPIRVGLGG